LKKSLENQSKDEVTNVVQTFMVWMRSGIQDNGHGVMTKMPTMCNTCVIEIHDLKKFALISLPDKPLKGMSWNLGCTCTSQVVEKKLDQKQLNYIVKTNNVWLRYSNGTVTLLEGSGRFQVSNAIKSLCEKLS